MHVIRRVARTVRGELRRTRARILRRLGLLKNDWATGLPAEVTFWAGALRENGRNWEPTEFKRRTDPNRQLQDELKALIDAPPRSTVRILDVGAGPLTTLGKQWTDRILEVVAVDPLAESYQQLLQKLEIRPPVETKVGHGERLLETFHENEFDLAYASNSLDHSYDPLLAIQQMFQVVKPGHYVYLWHFANEGLQEGYHGLHQWNFDVCQNDFTISDGRRKHSLQAEFGPRGRLSCEEITAYGKRVIIAKLQKLRV